MNKKNYVRTAKAFKSKFDFLMLNPSFPTLTLCVQYTFLGNSRDFMCVFKVAKKKGIIITGVVY